MRVSLGPITRPIASLEQLALSSMLDRAPAGTEFRIKNVISWRGRIWINLIGVVPVKEIRITGQMRGDTK